MEFICSVIPNMLGNMIGPSEETASKIRPWVAWGFIGLVVLAFLIYFFGERFLCKEGPGFWSITSNKTGWSLQGQDNQSNNMPDVNKDAIKMSSGNSGVQGSSERGSPVSSMSRSSTYEHSI